MYESRDIIPDDDTEIITAKRTVEEVCITELAYHGIIGTIIIVCILLVVFVIIAFHDVSNFGNKKRGTKCDTSI